jgi:hypothetical protein
MTEIDRSPARLLLTSNNRAATPQWSELLYEEAFFLPGTCFSFYVFMEHSSLITTTLLNIEKMIHYCKQMVFSPIYIVKKKFLHLNSWK